MASTTFIDGQSVIYASWLNDVNSAVYSGTFPNGSISLTNLSVSGSVTGAGFTNLVNNTLVAPGAIGSGTPNTGKFTTLTATGALSAASASFTSALPIASGGTGLTSVGTSGYLVSSNGSSLVYTKVGLGITGETWHTVTGSRSVGTTYTNPNSYPISVQIFSTGAGASSSGTLTVGGVVVSEVGGDTTNGAASSTLSAIVPPGTTYIVGGSRGIGFWAELY
jgi:hypothetical protein